MSIPELERMVERWNADAGFREAVRRDPEGAISAAGFELDDTEWGAIAETDWTLPDAELRGRLAVVTASPPA